MTIELIVHGMEEIAAFKSLNSGCRRVLWFAIDLINRQKAEIERLEKARQKQAQFLGEERGQKYELINKITKAKSEAIREFAERLKSVSHPYADTQMVFELQIDNLLKEMVGDE